jgi:hypothetical protein
MSPGTQTLDTSTLSKTFTVGQSVAGTGKITWSYTELQNIDVVTTDQYARFTVRANTNIPSQSFTVGAVSETGLAATSVVFTVEAYLEAELEASDQVLDLTTDQFVTFGQTVSTSATGAIVWGYPGGSNVFSSSDSELVLAFPAGSAYRALTPLTVTATNAVGVVTTKTVQVSASLRPVITTPSSNLVLDTTITQAFTVSQTAAPSSTGTIVWTYENLPTSITVTAEDDTTLTFQVDETVVIAPPRVFIVTAKSQTGLASSSITFNVSSATKPFLITPGNQTLDTTTQQTFVVSQTAQNYGTIIWSVTPSFPAGVQTLQQDSGLTVIVPQGTSTPATSYTVTATNIVGTVSTPVVFTLASAVRPVLIGPAVTTFDTTSNVTFTVTQTINQPTAWVYTPLPSGVSLQSTTDTALTFLVVAGSYFTANNVVFTVTNQAGISTALGITIEAFIPSAFTMNFGASTVPAVTDGGVFQFNDPPPNMSYPPVSLFINTSNTSVSYDITGQPYGNGSYAMSVSSTSNNMTTVFSLTESPPWTTGAVYSAGAYTGAVTTFVNNALVAGEWVQLAMPDTIACTSIQLTGSGATAYTLAGSNDGDVWISVLTEDNVPAQTFRTAAVTSSPPAFRIYRFIARTIDPSVTRLSLAGLQIVGAYSYVTPQLVNPRRISLLTSAPQTFTIAQVASPAATGPLTWTTTPYLADTSASPATPVSPVVSATTPFSNVSDGSFTGVVTLTDSKLDFDPTLTDFTLEMWVYGLSTTNMGGIISRAPAVVHGGLIDWQLYQGASEIYFQFNSYRVGVRRKVIPTRVWTHVAFVIRQNVATLYVNGSRIAAKTNVIGTSYVPGRPIFVGAGNTGTSFDGYISNLRMVKGYADYTDEFTPPTAPLTPTTLGETVLLLRALPTLPPGISVASITPAGITFTAALGTFIDQTMTVRVQNPSGASSEVTFSIVTVGSASGGDTIQDINGYRIHTFTTVGTSAFTTTIPLNVEVLVVAGGGGGGYQVSNQTGGGGGAGELIYRSSVAVNGTTTVTVGTGGLSGTRTPTVRSPTNGSSSVFGSLTAQGGGRGGNGGNNGSAGGSGGGAGRNTTNGGGASTATVGLGNAGGLSQGLITSSIRSGGGGGGATSVGQNAVGSATRAAGGIGYTSSISGTSRVYAAGGAGGARNLNVVGANAVANSGGGGGGADGEPNSGVNGGSGGSGIVIVRYPL